MSENVCVNKYAKAQPVAAISGYMHYLYDT